MLQGIQDTRFLFGAHASYLFKRLRKLVLMLSIALALAIKIGAQIEKEDLIRTIKANGSKAYTWFKAGLKVITAWLTSKPPHLASFFSCLEGIMETV